MLAEAGIKVKYVARALLRNFKNEVSLKRWHAEEEPVTGNNRIIFVNDLSCLLRCYVFFHFFHKYFLSFFLPNRLSVSDQTRISSVWLWLAHMAGLFHSITWLAYASLNTRGHALFAYNCPILLAGQSQACTTYLAITVSFSLAPTYLILFLIVLSSSIQIIIIIIIISKKK